MALSRLLFMAARIVASNPRLRKEVQKAAEASYTKAKPYINKANENIKLGFAYEKFAKLIIKNSNVSLIKIENEASLKKLIKQTGYGEKIYIGMGAGSISNWMRNL